MIQIHVVHALTWRSNLDLLDAHVIISSKVILSRLHHLDLARAVVEVKPVSAVVSDMSSLRFGAIMVISFGFQIKYHSSR